MLPLSDLSNWTAMPFFSNTLKLDLKLCRGYCSREDYSIFT